MVMLKRSVTGTYLKNRVKVLEAELADNKIRVLSLNNSHDEWVKAKEASDDKYKDTIDSINKALQKLKADSDRLQAKNDELVKMQEEHKKDHSFITCERDKYHRQAQDLEKNVTYSEVMTEVARQEVNWGATGHPDGTGGNHDKVHATVAKSISQADFSKGKGTWKHRLMEEASEAFAQADLEILRKELIEVCAVTLAWIWDIDKRR